MPVPVRVRRRRQGGRFGSNEGERLGRVVCGSEIMEDAVSNEYFFMRNMNNEHDSTKDTSMPSSILLVARVLPALFDTTAMPSSRITKELFYVTHALQPPFPISITCEFANPCTGAAALATANGELLFDFLPRMNDRLATIRQHAAGNTSPTMAFPFFRLPRELRDRVRIPLIGTGRRPLR